jgi:hypothetical protein
MRCVALRVLGTVRNHGSGHVGVAWLGETLLSPGDPRPAPVRRQGPRPLAPGQKASGGASRPRWGPGRGHRGGGSQLAGPGELARCRGGDGRGGLRGGQRGGQALGGNVAPGRKYTGRTGDGEVST